MKSYLILPFSFWLLASCSLAPDYLRPDVAAPKQWSQPSNVQADQAVIARNWWTSFNSAELDRLMDKALTHNHELLAGIQQVEQARANLAIAGGTLLPRVDASAGAARNRLNPAQGTTSSASNLQAGANIAYELDLFGANRSLVAGTQANLQASQYDQDALSLVVMGDAAQTYFTLINLRERLAIADDNLANAQEVLRIIQARVDRGSESELQLAQQKTVVASREAARAALTEQLRNAENALAVLTGDAPQTQVFEGKSLNGLTIPAIATGQPSQLLERRPDLRAAEADLAVADADIGIARAAFFPSISLGLNSSIATTAFGNPAATALSLASSLTAPIFHGGQLQGGLDQATARQKQLVENYRQDVLVAFREVEDALIAADVASMRETALQQAMEQARKAYALSKSRYDAGAIDFQTLLDTQDSQLSAEDSFAQARLNRLTAAISLFKALGGGWEAPK